MNKITAVLCNKIKAVTLKLPITSAKIAFIKKFIFNELKPKFSVVK